MGDRELQTSDAASIATLKGRTLQLSAWRDVLPEQPVSNRPFFTQVRPAAVTTPLTLRVSGLKPGRYNLRIRRTGYDHNGAYSAYLRTGRPATISLAQLDTLQSLTTDTVKLTDLQVGRDGVARSQIPMRDNDIVMVELSAP